MGDTNSQQQGQTQADLYQYNYDYIEPIAMVDRLPQSENFSMPWIVLTAQQVLKLAINTLIVNLNRRGSQSVEADVKGACHFCDKYLYLGSFSRLTN